MYELRSVEKRFPGVHALKGIDFHVKRGEIVGLVGENGAGKSTLMKVIYGAYRPDAGQILIDGREVRFASPRQAMARGIGMVFQEQSLIPNLPVMENIFLGYEAEFARRGILSRARMAEAARRQLAKVRLAIDPATPTAALSFAQRQLVELAKVLTLEERVAGHLVILLDEPTSVLSEEEVRLLFRLVRDLAARASFIFVSHRLDEVMELSDRIYVLKDGAVADVAERGSRTVEDIQHRMVGRSVDRDYYREPRQVPHDTSRVLVEMAGVRFRPGGPEIALRLHAGEVLGLVGTEGAGREAILRAIAGLRTPLAGRITLRGRDLGRHSPQNAVALGIGYVPRERKVEGIVAGMSVAENMTLSQLGRHAVAGMLRPGRERALARDWIARLGIKAPSPEADCGNLSGGNQQKVVLARWRSGGAGILLLDHPTRGLDIGAKGDVYDMIREMSAEGLGVLLVADTLEEAIGLSHTILVLKDGAIRARFDGRPGAKPTPYDLIHAMT